MIDHVLGRPSVKSRRLQVLTVLGFWSAYLFKGHKHGPPFVRFFSRFTSRALTTWQTVLLTLMYLYAARNFSTLVGIASPEPMADMYSATYFRATWVLTALDAGFWTAMKIKRKWLRDIASIVFSLFYLVAAEQADEKVRKVRGMVTVEHLRVSWNKGTSPYLGFFQNLMRPRFTNWPPREVRIHRPVSSDYNQPIMAWVYFDGTRDELKECNKIILDIPGGGFVAMNPRTNDDKLLSWAAKTRVPIVSLDYKKAPEFPYPYAINECYDAYTAIILSKGFCIGLSGKATPQVIVTGDSAGGNLATAMTLMVIQSGTTPARRLRGQQVLPVPTGLVLFYPALDMNIGNWMSDEQMSLIRDRRNRGTNKSIMRRKSAQYNDLVGTPIHSDDENEGLISNLGANIPENQPPSITPESSRLPHTDTVDFTVSKENGNNNGGGSTVSNSPHPEFSHALRESWNPPTPPMPNITTNSSSHRPKALETRLAMSSMISYFNDRVLTPELMRAMIILYIGPHNRPDFATDYLLSPILAPDGLLAQFPKTIFLTGERDPLVDDTVIFAGRLKRVKRETHKRTLHRCSQDLQLDAPLDMSDDEFDEKDATEVVLLPGVSHGFLQFPTVFPPAWELFARAAEWMDGLFRDQEVRERDIERAALRAAQRAHLETQKNQGERSVRIYTGDSTDDERPLEMAMTRSKKNAPLSLSQDQKHLQSSVAAAKTISDGVEHVDNDVIDDGAGFERKALTKPTPRKKSRVDHTTRDLTRLKSSDDLLGRRMNGVAGGLMGIHHDDDD